MQPNEGTDFSPNVATPSDSASVTPSHSQADLHKLLSAVASTPQNRLGFGVATASPVGLRTSVSAKQLNRMPLPVATSSNSLFSSHLDDDESDTDSPEVDDDETHGRLGQFGSMNSLVIDGDETLEGAEYLDIGGSPVAAEEDSFTFPSDTSASSPVPNSSATIDPNALFHRCSLNALDPVDPSHNLGASISYKHEYHIRKQLRDGFLGLKNAMQRFSFRFAAQLESSSTAELDDADRANAELDQQPVMLEIFERAQLSRFKELQLREARQRRVIVPSPAASPHPTAAESAVQSKVASSLDQVFQHSSTAFTSSTVSELTSSSSGSLFAVTLSPSRDRAMGGLIIVDDTPVPAPAPTVAAPSPTPAKAPESAANATAGNGNPSVFDTLSGDFDKIIANLDHARQFETPDLTDDELVHLVIDLLKERVSVPVGRMGSLLHDVTNNHSLPAMLKEQFGGLKRYLERHPDIFHVGRDHPYNPNVSLKPKWYNFAPPRPLTLNAHQAQGGSLPNSSSANGLSSAHGSSGNLQALANGAPGSEGRKKLQRRRTRTRRTGSGASTGPSSQAAQAVRNGLVMDGAAQSPAYAAAPVIAHPRAVVTPIIALDCEMVGVGPSGLNSMLARISITNFNGELLYDKFVAPSEPVTDYRTHLSGILPQHLEVGLDFRQVQREVSQIVKNRILVGHGLVSDLQALQISIPRQQLRDTAVFKLYCPHRPLPLKQLVKEHLAHLPEFVQFQEYQHNPVADARAALALYKIVQQQWEGMVLQESQQLGHVSHSHSQPSMSQQAQSSFHTRELNPFAILQAQQQPQYQSAALLSHHQPQQFPSFPSPQQQQQQQRSAQHSRTGSIPSHYTSAAPPQQLQPHVLYDLPPQQIGGVHLLPEGNLVQKAPPADFQAMRRSDPYLFT